MTVDDNGDAWYTEEELRSMFPDSMAITFFLQPPERPRVIAVTVSIQAGCRPSGA